jgi:hypothetical protein
MMISGRRKAGRSDAEAKAMVLMQWVRTHESKCEASYETP